MPPAKIMVFAFIKKEQIAPEYFSFYFSPSEPIAFAAGQYIQLSVPHKNADFLGTSRFFTIASSPTEKYIMITTRILSADLSADAVSSFKKTLLTLSPGTSIAGFGPIGKFVLEEED